MKCIIIMTSNVLDINKRHVVNREFLYKKGLCGIANLGNTCYMNSIIQCLNNTIPFSRYFLENQYLNDLNPDVDESIIIREWNSISRGLWHKNSVITPGRFHKAIQLNAIRKGHLEFSGFGQNDSQEFLQFLLEAMHNPLSKRVHMNIAGKAKNEIDKLAISALEYWIKFFKDDYSKIIELFYGQYISKVLTIKDGVSEISYSYDPFSCISLELSPNATCIYDCLNNHCAKEYFADSHSSKKQYKTPAFWKLPEILVIFFKRFNNEGAKLRSNINFPINQLDMSKYVVGYNKSKYKYDLYAVSNHSGNCIGGHYYAYCKNADNQWYQYDDNVVSTLSKDKVVSEAAYCLFYQLNN
jgi:ubiquitin C-terminal hydrolase